MEKSAPKNKESLAELEKKVRRRVACEKHAHEIVVSLIDNPISEDYLLEQANYLHASHYVDVTEERAIEHLCGYPLCQKTLPKQPKQKYHISTRHNKVYDITERKNFCSNRCFKASKYFEKQISTSAVWARENEPRGQFNIIPIDGPENRGSAGDEVLTNPASEIKQELKSLDAERPSASASRFTSVNDLVNKVSDLLVSDQKETENDSARGSTLPQEASASGGKDDNELTNSLENKSSNQDQHEISLKDLADQVSEEFLLDEGSTGANTTDEVPSDIDIDNKERMNARVTKKSKDHRETLSKSAKKPAVHVANFAGEKDLELFQGQTKKYGSFCKEIGNTKVLPARKGVDPKQNDPMVPVAQPDILQQGTREEETINTTIGNKAKLLFDLIEKRDNLHAQLRKTSPNKELDKPSAPQLQSDFNPVLMSQTKPIANPNRVHHNNRKTELSFEADQELLRKNVKVKASSVMDNIRRVASQQSGHKPSQPPIQNYPKVSPLDPIRSAMFEWKTPETVSYFSSGCKSRVELSAFEQKYAALGRMVDKQDVSNLLGEEEWEEEKAAMGRLPDYKQLRKDTVQQDIKVREYFKGNLKYPVLADEEDEDDAELPACFRAKKGAPVEEEVREPVLPLVDAHSQMAIRRKIVLDKLSHVLPDLLRPLRLGMIDIISDLRSVVHSFNFTATNILFKPPEWILLGYVLLQLLAVKIAVLRRALKEENCASLYKGMMESAGVQETDVSYIIQFMISEEQSLAHYRPT